MTRQQCLDKLKNVKLSDEDRERILQHLHYLDAEGITGPKSAKRPKKNFTHKKISRD